MKLYFRNTCVVKEKIHTHPTQSHWKFPGVGGVFKAKFLEAMYENKPEFPAKQKTFCGGVWIFLWNSTI